MPSLVTVTRIISGAQTGADRGALDFALEKGFDYGGWCPKNRKAQDGRIPDIYANLEETMDQGYTTRTRWNVRDSDGTVIFTNNPPGKGSALTIRSCLDQGKPYLVVTLEESIMESSCNILGFIRRNQIKTLNVAGSRIETWHHRVRLVLRRAFADQDFSLDKLKQEAQADAGKR